MNKPSPERAGAMSAKEFYRAGPQDLSMDDETRIFSMSALFKFAEEFAAHSTQALREYIQKRIAFLESEFKFDSHMDLNDWDTSTWSDAHQRAYGEYTALLKIKNQLED